jgi:hypothetical protein
MISDAFAPSSADNLQAPPKRALGGRSGRLEECALE